MNIKPVQNNPQFKAYSSIDAYRLEQKIDQLRAQLDKDGDLNSFYKDLPKSRRLPMPLGVPPYAMAGTPAPMYGMPPMGPMGMQGGPMGMPGMMPGMPGGFGPMGNMYSPTSPMPPIAANPITLPPNRFPGQLPTDTFGPRKN